MSDTDPDWTAEAESRLIAAAARLSAGRIWGRRLFDQALAEAGLTAADGELLAPDGPRDLAALLFARHDAQAALSLAGVDPGGLKIRDRIFMGARARVEAAFEDAEAVAPAALFLARPDNAALGARLLWRSADLIWRWAGDRAVDENHYSKRAILAGVMLSAIRARLSGGPEAAEADLRRRIEQVMAFETFKAKLPPLSKALGRAASELGRLRYAAVRDPGVASDD